MALFGPVQYGIGNCKISKLSPPPGTDWPVDELEKPIILKFVSFSRKKMQPDSAHSGWAVAQGDTLRNFSVVGYFFAKELQKIRSTRWYYFGGNSGSVD